MHSKDHVIIVEGRRLLIQFHEYLRRGEAFRLVKKSVDIYNDQKRDTLELTHELQNFVSFSAGWDDSYVCAVDEVSGIMVAVLTFSREIGWNGVGNIGYAYTEPTFRGKGIGGYLMDAAIGELIAQGNTLISRNVSLANDAGINKLYADDRFKPSTINFTYIPSSQEAKLVIDSQKQIDPEIAMTLPKRKRSSEPTDGNTQWGAGVVVNVAEGEKYNGLFEVVDGVRVPRENPLSNASDNAPTDSNEAK